MSDTKHKINDAIYKVLRGTYNLVMMTKKEKTDDKFFDKLKNIRNKKRIAEEVITEPTEK